MNRLMHFHESILGFTVKNPDIFVHDKLIDNFQFQFVNVNQKYVSRY